MKRLFLSIVFLTALAWVANVAYAHDSGVEHVHEPENDGDDEGACDIAVLFASFDGKSLDTDFVRKGLSYIKAHPKIKIKAEEALGPGSDRYYCLATEERYIAKIYSDLKSIFPATSNSSLAYINTSTGLSFATKWKR